MKRVTIVGLGLIGGSIAKALRRRSSDLVLVGLDRCQVGERLDVKSTISQFIAIEKVENLREVVGGSDLVVLCQPVRAIAETVASYLSPGVVVTDTGSTKRHIVARTAGEPEERWFVPGHPMAGKELGGFANADAELFAGRPWIVCTEGREALAVERVGTLIELVGAMPVVMTPEEHDAAVAITSHVPQLFASWLRLSGHDRRALAAAGPTFAQMTRTAGGAESIWRDIFETNADEVGRRLRDAAFAFSAVADALLNKPPRIEVVVDLLAKARMTTKAD